MNAIAYHEARMAGAEFVNVFTYRDEVIVEVTVSPDEEGVAVRTFQFEYADGEGTVRPKGSVSPEHRGTVEQALAGEDLTLESAG